MDADFNFYIFHNAFMLGVQVLPTPHMGVSGLILTIIYSGEILEFVSTLYIFYETQICTQIYSCKNSNLTKI